VHTEKAIDLNPNDTEAREHYGNLLTYIGEPEKALEQLELAKRQNPFGMSRSPWVRGIAYFTARRYGEAIGAFNQIHEPNHEVLLYVTASHAHAGRLAEARTKLQDFLRLARRDMAHFPDQDAARWIAYLSRSAPFKEERDMDHLCDGLRLAGLAI
jgi:tetratricopeptide (TPR) repeat protein